MRKHFPEIQGKEDFRVKVHFSFNIFRKFFIHLRMKLISILILIASGLLLQINLVSRYNHTIASANNR